MRSIIDSYGEFYVFHYHNDEKISPKVMLSSNTSITRIYGHGIDDPSAVVNLYNNLHAAIKTIVKRIEDEDHGRQ